MGHITYTNNEPFHVFKDWKSAYDWLIERIFTVSKQFGFKMCPVPYDWSV
jgi:hypothetical protein